MPIYEYVCKACEHELDALQKIADAPLRDCPACGAAELRRKISAPSFRLKGQGWYETDFKSDKDKRRNLAETSDKASAAPAKEASSDKPAKKEAANSGGDGKAA